MSTSQVRIGRGIAGTLGRLEIVDSGRRCYGLLQYYCRVAPDDGGGLRVTIHCKRKSAPAAYQVPNPPLTSMAASVSAPKCSTEIDSGLVMVAAAAAAAAAAAGPRNVRSPVPAIEAIESDCVPSSIPRARLGSLLELDSRYPGTNSTSGAGGNLLHSRHKT